MGTEYPEALDAFENPSAATPMNSAVIPHSRQHGDVNDAIEALEAKLGIGASPAMGAASTDVLSRLADGSTGWANSGLFLPSEIPTFYVSKDARASDDNDGSRNAPFATVAGALAAVGGTADNTDLAIIQLLYGTFDESAVDTHTVRGVSGFRVRGLGPVMTEVIGPDAKAWFAGVNTQDLLIEDLWYSGSPNGTGWCAEFFSNVDTATPDTTVRYGTFVGRMAPEYCGGRNVLVGSGMPVGYSTTTPARANSTLYALNAKATISVGGVTYVLRATTGGTSAGSAPSWNTAPGATTNDGTVVWTSLGPKWTAAYGFRWRLLDDLAANDANNDKGVLEDVTFYGVEQPIEVGHSNSLEHRFDRPIFNQCGGGVLFRGGSAEITNPIVGSSIASGYFIDCQAPAGVATARYYHRITVTNIQSEAGPVGWARSSSDAGLTGGGVATQGLHVQFIGGELNAGPVGAADSYVVDWEAVSETAGHYTRLEFIDISLRPRLAHGTIYAPDASSELVFVNCYDETFTINWGGRLSFTNCRGFQSAGLLTPIGGAVYSEVACSGGRFKGGVWIEGVGAISAVPQIVTASGSVTVPKTAGHARITCVGGGGGGGGGGSSSGQSAQVGGGGGGSGGVTKRVVPVTPGGTLTVTIGAGGPKGTGGAAGGNAGTNGTIGGTTTVTDGSFTVSAVGGGTGRAGGANSTAAALGGAWAGTAASSINSAGSGGQNTVGGGAPPGEASGGGGGGGTTTATLGGGAGAPGTANAGGATGAVGASGTAAGVDATDAASTSYGAGGGAGGGGAFNGGSTGKGGDGGKGGPGLVVIEWLP
jgi:hypothetical protein